MPRLDQLVTREVLTERIREAIVDYAASMIANNRTEAMADEMLDGADAVTTLVVDEVLDALSEIDSDEAEDWHATYDIEDDYEIE